MFLKGIRVNFIKNAKVSWRLTFMYSFIFSIVLLVLYFSILIGVKYYLINHDKYQLENASNTIIGTIEEWEDVYDGDLIEKTKLREKYYVKIFDESGVIYYASHDFSFPLFDAEPPLKVIKEVTTDEGHLMHKISKLKIGKTTVYLQVVKDVNSEYKFIKVLNLTMLALGLIGIVISVLSGFLVSRRVLKPINDITTIANTISISDLKSRIEVPVPDDELSRLAKTFNEMIGRLDTSFEKQNQFISDASHELRTPISIIQGYINMLDRWGKEDKAILQEAIDTIKNETVSMGKLIEKLLYIAKCDSDVHRLEKENFLLNELVDEVVKDCKIIAPNHNIACESNDTVSIYADRRMIKQMLRAFVDNSIKFTPEEGKISISSFEQKDNVKIVVKDTGIGIPESEKQNIFNRFYRVDKARSRETGGSGLGLSIVKWIVDVHGGTILAESTFGEGTTMTVYLPKMQDAKGLLQN